MLFLRRVKYYQFLFSPSSSSTPLAQAVMQYVRAKTKLIAAAKKRAQTQHQHKQLY